MHLTPGKASIVQAPIIEESPLCIECRIKEIISLGSHDMFIADVVNVKADEKSALDPRIPKKLRDLMIANDVCEWDIQNVCEAKGYVPVDTPLYMYEEVNPGFVDGVLVGAWSQVYAAIKEMKEKDALVFN